MVKPKPKYMFYATLLDAYMSYLKSGEIWDKYWGWSENPQYSSEEFEKNQFDDLINRINRVPFDSEAADRGTAFNEVIDCMIEKRKSDSVSVEKVFSNDGKVSSLRVTYNNRTFEFPLDVCRNLADYYEGALTQVRIEATLPTCFGDVLVYGVIDELMPNSVHDIKTTGSYSVGKFKDHFQHLVYPYALMQNGSDVRTFEYNVVEFSRYGNINGMYTESYSFNPQRDIPILRDHCEEFIKFINDNKELITDKKVFGIIEE